MLDMQLENERVARLRLQQVGEGWIQAIQEGAFERLEQYCQPHVISQLLLPKRSVSLDTVDDLVKKYRQWFAECTEFKLDTSRVGLVGERLGIFYRFHLQEHGDWLDIEQQLYCTLKDGRVEQLHLLCSGFQLVVTSD